MKIEEQVCSLELAKKLKELEVKQESLWFYNSETNKLQKGFTCHVIRKGLGKLRMKWSISAFTTSELGEMLPIDSCNISKARHIDNSIKHFCEYKDFSDDNFKCFEAETEANARAKMLVYLLENKLIKVEEVMK